jgi:hypothetical protein
MVLVNRSVLQDGPGIGPRTTPSEPGGKMRQSRLLGYGILCMTVSCIGPHLRPKAGWVPGLPEHVVEKDYVVGETKIARTGEAMVRVKDCWLQRTYPASVVLDRQVPNGRELENIGAIEIDNTQYIRYANANDDDHDSEIYYVRPDGTLANFLYERGRYRQMKGIRKIIEVSPEPFRFPFTNNISDVPNSEYQKYEISFRNKDQRGIHFNYEEFSKENPDTPSIQKIISLPSEQNYLTCNNLKIKVEKCTANDIDFTVVSD